uniref:Uncharacterized protein n=1 Tax=Chenopodium quinoa TaxID=63459 RepID=A0A803N8M6_CHEQI
MTGDKEVPASQVFQGEEETTRRSKKKGTRDLSRDPSVSRTLTSELEPRLMKVECTVANMHDDITQLSDSVEGLEGKVEAAHTATQDLRDETLGLVNSALATIREEVAKLKEELLGQLRDIRAEVESVKEDVILCKKAAVNQVIYFTGGLQRWAQQEVERRNVKTLAEAIAVAESLIEIPRESRRDRGRRVEEDDQEEEEASRPKARHADHGKDKAKSKWESKGDNRDGGKPSKPFKCFLCEGSHLARNCPMRQKLSAMIATEEESAPTTRMGAMVMSEDAQLANMRLLNTSRVEDDDLKGRASPTSSTTNIKQGGSSMIVNGEVNEVPTRLLVDTGASHNFLAKEEAKALGVKFTKVDGEMKAINSEATPVYGKAWGVPVRLGKWKGKVDFLVVDIDDEDVVLGMEFLHKVLPVRVSDGMITITSKGSEIGIKLAQLKERDVRVSTLKAWWAPRQRRQGAIHGRIKATKMPGTRHHGVPRDGTTRLKCGVNRRDGAAAHRSTQGTSGALDRVAGTMTGDKEVPASQVFQGEEETTRRSKKKGTRDLSRDPSVSRTLTSELEPRLMKVECTVANMHDDITQLSDSVEGLEGKVEAAHTATQDLRDETLGLVNSALATIREEVAKLKEELLGQLRDIRAEVESVKEDVILCKKAAVNQVIYFTGGLQRWAQQEVERRNVKTLAEAIAVAESLIEIPRESRRDRGRRVEEDDQEEEEASQIARCGKKLSAMIATEEESAPTTRMGAMVMSEDAQLANMRLLNTSRVEDDDLKGRASPTSSTTNIKQGGSSMIVNGEVNEVPTRLLVDTGASHNFLAKEEAKALGVKFTKVDGEMKAINSEATPVYGKAWGVPVRLGKWKGKVDFLVVDIDDEDVVLGMEFLHKVLPVRVSDGMITITSKGSEIGIKLAQLKERDVRVSTLKAWWAPRQRRQGAIHGRIKATKMPGTRHHGVPRDGTTRLKCGVNRRDGAAAHRSTQGTSGALDRVAGTDVLNILAREGCRNLHVGSS